MGQAGKNEDEDGLGAYKRKNKCTIFRHLPSDLEYLEAYGATRSAMMFVILGYGCVFFFNLVSGFTVFILCLEILESLEIDRRYTTDTK